MLGTCPFSPACLCVAEQHVVAGQQHVELGNLLGTAVPRVASLTAAVMMRAEAPVALGRVGITGEKGMVARPLDDRRVFVLGSEGPPRE